MGILKKIWRRLQAGEVCRSRQQTLCLGKDQFSRPTRNHYQRGRMKRSGFSFQQYIPRPSPAATKAQRKAILARTSDVARPHPKENVLVCEAYRYLVRLLPCAHCGYPAPSQFCHADQGKGMSIKTDDRRGWPGCGPRTGNVGCHYLIGMSGTISKTERRQLESGYARWTRDTIIAAGDWPRKLPLWRDEG